MRVRPWSEDVWFSPCYVINTLADTIRTGDKKKIKRHKETWICAVAMICHSKLRPAEWWIQVPKNDPPDVLAMNLVPCKNGQGQNIAEIKVEVFEISSHDTHERIEESIQRKFGKKDYSGMTLIGFVRRTSIFDHNHVSLYIQKLKPKALCIFLLVFEENSTNASLIQILPECVKFKCDFGAICKYTQQRDFIKLSRSTQIKLEDATTTDTMTLIP